MMIAHVERDPCGYSEEHYIVNNKRRIAQHIHMHIVRQYLRSVPCVHGLIQVVVWLGTGRAFLFFCALISSLTNTNRLGCRCVFLSPFITFFFLSLSQGRPNNTLFRTFYFHTQNCCRPRPNVCCHEKALQIRI